MTDHPHRWRVANELHARPFIAVRAPARLAHLSLLHPPDGAQAAHARVAALCERHAVEPLAPQAKHFFGRFGATLLKWESHAEFSSWTVWREDRGDHPFAGESAAALDVDWLDSLPGDLLVAVRMELLGAADPPPSPEGLHEWFEGMSLCGSTMGQKDRTDVWTDFRPDPAGFVRVLLHDHGSDARKLGRRVQRLLEIETYRTMALLALPLAQEVAPRIDDIEARLARIAQNLQILENLPAEEELLGRLMKLSAESEELSATTAFRFSAADAYFEIVRERLAQVDERRLGALPTIGGFMGRRLSPAMRTCASARARQEALAGRIARAANLLRTRVDLAVEAQNRALLASMERRARLQVRLQQTVEGLSVAAITYYVVSLISYLAKSTEAAGVGIDPDVVTGAAVPVVAIAIWWTVRRFRRRIARDES